MSGRASRKRKAAWKASVARMQQAKARKRKRDSEESPVVESSIASTCSGGSSRSILEAREDEKMTARISAQTDSAEARAEYYTQWINSLDRNDVQILAMMLYDIYRETFGLQKTAAAEQVGLRLGLCDKTIRIWRKTFLNNGRFNPDGRGKYPRNHQTMHPWYVLECMWHYSFTTWIK